MVRWTRSLTSLASSLALLALLAAPALADGGQREEPVTPMDSRPAEVVETPAQTPAATVEVTPLATTRISRRNWTVCEQLRVDIDHANRDYFHLRAANRRDAYAAMRNGNIDARYLGENTQCTPCRHEQLEQRLSMLMMRTGHLQEYIAQHPVGMNPGYPFPGRPPIDPNCNLGPCPVLLGGFPLDGMAGMGWMGMGMLPWDRWNGPMEHWTTHSLYPHHNEIEPPGRPENRWGYHVGEYEGDKGPN
ncbi:MAG: hypothetical protein ABI743_10690 [bacterium]